MGTPRVVTARADVKGHQLGEDFSGPYRYTRVWVRRNGQWQIAELSGYGHAVSALYILLRLPPGIGACRHGLGAAAGHFS